MTQFRPADAQELRQIVADCLAAEQPLEIVAGGSKRTLGRPLQVPHTLDVTALSGVLVYEPAELVLTAAAATPLAEIEALLAAQNQMLAFEPPDWGALLGGGAGRQTLGGVLSVNLGGPRRPKAGAARDHFLGFEAVSGRGEAFKAGGQVVKNVTGYDLCKLMAGAYGTLAVLTQVSVKVLPAPEKSRTVLLYGLDDKTAIAVLADGLNSPHEVSGAAHLPTAVAALSAVERVAGAGKSVTALRLEGPGPSVAYRCEALRRMLAARGQGEELHSMNSARFWREVADVAPFAGGTGPVWRLSVAPAAGASVAAAIGRVLPMRHFYDWGGGLLWIALEGDGGPDGGAAAVRAAMPKGGGHATLMRGAASLRATEAVFEPQEAALAALTRRVKDGFDPRRILNPGRVYAGV